MACPRPVSSVVFLFSVSGSFFLVLVVVDWNDVKVHLAMAPVAVMLNLRADALTAAYRGNNQRGRPTTGSRTAYCLSARCFALTLSPLRV